MDGGEAGLSRVPPNAVLGVVAALVVVLAVVTALLTTQRERPELDPGTPEGTVQIFILAFVEGDDDQAQQNDEVAERGKERAVLDHQ